MSWDCCSPRGECRLGPGCPAGVLFEQADKSTSCPAGMCTSKPGCADTACPGHPAARSGLPTVDLRRVHLFSPGKRKRKSDRGMWLAVLVAFALLVALSTFVQIANSEAPAAAPASNSSKKVTT